MRIVTHFGTMRVSFEWRRKNMSATYTYWQDPNGWYVGYWNDYPDHSTQGHTHEELKHMLLSLRADIREMIAEGVMPDDHKNVGELAFA